MTDFDYNTSREKLILPEYGRNIQKMVNYATNINESELRNSAAKSLIAVMGNLNPHLRDVNDFKHKLWDHLQIISNFSIDIDSPYPVLKKEVILEKPRRVPYSLSNLRYKHYGKNVEYLIDEALKMEDMEQRLAFCIMIANMMKKFYLTWNKEAVSDLQIFRDLNELSRGKIVIPSEIKLSETRDLLAEIRKAPAAEAPLNNKQNQNKQNQGRQNSNASKNGQKSFSSQNNRGKSPGFYSNGNKSNNGNTGNTGNTGGGYANKLKVVKKKF